MKAEQLWASILQEAIQGKLVPQLESEPPSPCLCDQPEEIPFEIPTKWTWAYITNIADLLPSRNFQIKTNEIESKGSFPVVSQSQHFIDGFSNKEEKVITEERLPLIIFGDHTRVVKVIDFPFVVGADGTKLLIPKTDVIDIQYLEKVLLRYRETMRNRGYARHFSVLKKMPIPVPPLSEQKRIVKLLQGLKPLIDVYGKEFDLLTSMENEFPTKLKSSILQEAIQGRLVPQLESEPEVVQIGETPEDVPFAIPEKWKWCTFGNVVAYGKCEQIQPQNIEENAWILDLEDIEKGTGNLLQKKKGISVQSNKNRFKKGDVLYSKLRPYLNKVIVANDDGYCTTEIVPISLSVAQAPLDAQYLKVYLMSPYFVSYASQCSYGVKMPRLGTKDAQKALFPIPPISEQRRIVAKLTGLLNAVNQLRNTVSIP